MVRGAPHSPKYRHINQLEQKASFAPARMVSYVMQETTRLVSSTFTKMRVLLTFTLSFFAAFAPTFAFAWGGDGHRIICAIAWDELKARTRHNVEALLNVHTREAFVEECNWADVYRRSHPETSPWHFVNVPTGARTVDLAHDCTGAEGCATSQVELRRRQLRSHDPAIDKTLALRVLLHAVGDEHQPLHVTVENGDRGGKQIKGHFLGREISMHAIWDSALLASAGRSWQDTATDLQQKISVQQRRRWSHDSRLSWANESLAISLDPKTEYDGQKNGFEFSDAYVQANLPVVFDRLSRAGVRLAYLLNDTLSGR